MGRCEPKTELPEDTERLSDWLRGLLLAHLERGPDATFRERLALAEWRTAAALWDRLHIVAVAANATVRESAHGLWRSPTGAGAGAGDRIDRAVAELRRR